MPIQPLPKQWDLLCKLCRIHAPCALNVSWGWCLIVSLDIHLQDLMNDFVCLCVAGWEGKDCRTEANECIPEPCSNGATCTVSAVV